MKAVSAKQNSGSITVLGAGIQGVCVALALRRAGYRVKLIDQADDALTRASLRNEGKIHLGLVYAHDRSGATSNLMLRSALCFDRLIDSWLSQPLPWSELISSPFVYLVPADTMLQPSELFTAYDNLQAEYQRVLQADNQLSYLGEQPQRLWEEVRTDSFSSMIAADRVLAAVSTAELALDLPQFCALLRAEVNAAPEIDCRYNQRIEQVERCAAGFRVSGSDSQEASWQLESERVVNCLWEGRLAIDQQLGLLPKRPWIYRLKFRLLGRLPPQLDGLPSMTMVLGPYGDIVVSPGKETYFSWYPSCMKGWSDAVCTPEHWQLACRGQTPALDTEEISREALAGLEQFVPGISASTIRQVDAGVIFSWGKTDIDDSASELHQRHEIGVNVEDGYFSIDTGKFTSAPLFAEQLLEKL